jgi:predicted permease
MRPGEGETNGAGPGIVLGYDYWQNRFGGSPGVIGQKVILDGHATTIVGVAPKGFHGLYTLVSTQAYIPLGLVGLEGLASDFLENRTFRNILVYGRLRPGQSLSQAQALLNVVATRISHDHPESDKDLTLQVFPELRSRPSPDSDGTILMISILFLALAGMVLLLAGVNVANFLLVRATVRQREMAIRVALGAARATLIRQLLTESLLLGICGGAFGILLGTAASTALSSIPIGTDLPLHLDFAFDWRVFGYAFAGALLAGLVVGVVPALRASKANVNEVLHQGGRGSVGGRHRLRNVLVSAQVAVSLMLLIIAGLFTRSLAEAQRIDLGFSPSHLVNFDMDPSEIGYNEAQGQIFYRNLLDRVRALPRVQSTSLAANVPMGYINSTDDVTLPGKEKPSTISYDVVTPGYFDTMGIKVLRGRAFTDADKADSPFAAVVSQGMAKELWQKQDPIGREFHMVSDPAHVLRIVGVVNDTKQTPRGRRTSFFYVPLAQHYTNNSFETLQVRTTGDPRAIMPQVEKTIHSLAPDLPVFDVQTMTEALYTLNGLLMFQLGAGLAGALGLLGLVLAVIGVYGVISYAASQQTHEIGLRMALGAKPASILGMMFSRGLLIIGLGLLAGLGAAVAVAGVVGKFVVISPTDPLTYGTVTGLLAAVALFACYIPARRAMRVDPMVALRYD